MPINLGGLMNHWPRAASKADKETRVRDERLVFYSLAV